MSEDLEKRIQLAEENLKTSTEALAALRLERPKLEVQDYKFSSGQTGESILLSQLFEGGEELIVVHNMGAKCPGCTAWADGFNGLYSHLKSRAPFVVSSPDSLTTQRQLLEQRGWRFPLVSTVGTTFPEDMGFYDSQKSGDPYQPGVSTFEKATSGKVYRTSFARFGPGDLYFPAFHFFALLRSGKGDWFPRVKY